MSNTEPDRADDRDDDYSEVDADDVVEDAVEFYEAPDTSHPVAEDAEAEPPPG